MSKPDQCNGIVRWSDRPGYRCSHAGKYTHEGLHYCAHHLPKGAERVEAGASGAAQDAKRYQWLRKNAEVNFDEVQCWPLDGTGKKIYSRMPTKLELDVAIDAAIDEAVEAQQRGSGNHE